MMSDGNDVKGPTTTHHQVRQILMNELGLTRDTIRDTMREIIVEEMQKRCGDTDLFHAIVIAALNKRSRESYPKFMDLEKILREEIRNMIAGDVRQAMFLNGIQITLPLAPAKPT